MFLKFFPTPHTSEYELTLYYLVSRLSIILSSQLAANFDLHVFSMAHFYLNAISDMCVIRMPLHEQW